MKKLRNSFVILCSAAFCFAFSLTACKGGTSNKTEYTVTFDSQGGSAVEAQKVKHGEKATKPADPARENYEFTGWYEDQVAITPFDFKIAITADWTIYAGWKAGSVIPPVDSPYYVTIGTTTYGLEDVTSTATLLDSQTGEFKATVSSVTAGQTVAFLDSNKVELSENFGAEPGQNNVSGEVGSFTIHNDASNVMILLKTWESGWTNFYISGYESGGSSSGIHGPDGSTLVNWYIAGSGSLWEGSTGWSQAGAIQMYSNAGDKACALGVTLAAGDSFKITDFTTWLGYSALNGDAKSSFKEAATDGNIEVVTAGTYKFYLNNSNQIYVLVDA
ncbi:MAG: InlB B-repeat-containing protein [Bacilli bacterium]|nr:InlB B-repeat-containing protein [Bacilli bacterium]